MGFYTLSKEERVKKVQVIYDDLLTSMQSDTASKITEYFSDPDTYIRKAAYQSIGKLFSRTPVFRKKIVSVLSELYHQRSEYVRQTTINAAGEIGMRYFELVEPFFDKGLFDEHHIVRNAVIGSVKKMGEKNPTAVLLWAKKYLHHPDKEIRREICHGIELRGRTHPEDILPLLKELQHDKTTRVRTTLVHVLGQISYKKGCLPKVIAHLNDWENKELVAMAIQEILDVHERYKDFAALTVNQAKDYIDESLEKGM